MLARGGRDEMGGGEGFAVPVRMGSAAPEDTRLGPCLLSKRRERASSASASAGVDDGRKIWGWGIGLGGEVRGPVAAAAAVGAHSLGVRGWERG